jgi:hypothetical protein
MKKSLPSNGSQLKPFLCWSDFFIVHAIFLPCMHSCSISKGKTQLCQEQLLALDAWVHVSCFNLADTVDLQTKELTFRTNVLSVQGSFVYS